MPDLTLTLTIPEAKIQKVRDGFLQIRPKPEEDLELTDKQYLEKVLLSYIKRITIAGLRELASQNEDVSTIEEIE